MILLIAIFFIPCYCFCAAFLAATFDILVRGDASNTWSEDARKIILLAVALVAVSEAAFWWVRG